MKKEWIVGLCAACTIAFAGDIALPKPRISGGMPLMEALNARRTERAFDTKKALPMQMVSDLLWAANGINRADGRRTAPTARNFQEQELYILLPEGGFFYDAKANKLVQISTEANPLPALVVIVCDTK